MKAKSQLPLTTPGELIQLEFIEPLGVTAYRLAKSLNVPGNRIHEILKGDRSITADTALRLERFFGLSDGYFLRLQADYDLRKAKRELSEIIQAEVRPFGESEAISNEPVSYLVEHRGRRKWAVVRSGAKRAASVHATQRSAIKSARMLATSKKVEYVVQEPKAKYGKF